MPVTKDYIGSLAECWNRDKLEAAAQLWPIDVNWSWFCGDRLRQYGRARQLEVLAVCHAHIMKQKLRVKHAPGVQYEWARTADLEDFLTMMRELGAELDAAEAAPESK